MEYNLPDHYRGDTWGGMTVQVRDGDNNSPSTKLAKVRMHVRDRPKGSLLLALSSEDDSIEFDEDVWDITVKPVEANMPAGTHYYDLETVDAGGTVLTCLRGRWTLTQDITE